jgi:hypothetical protein
VHALALRRADRGGQRGLERQGEVAGVDALALMGEIGGRVDEENLAADLLPYALDDAFGAMW